MIEMPEASEIQKYTESSSGVKSKALQIISELGGVLNLVNRIREYTLYNISYETFYELKWKRANESVNVEEDMEYVAEYLRSKSYYVNIRFCATSGSTYGSQYGQTQLLVSTKQIPENYYCI